MQKNNQFYDPWEGCATTGFCPSGTCWNYSSVGHCPTTTGNDSSNSNGGSGQNSNSISSVQNQASTTRKNAKESVFTIPMNWLTMAVVVVLLLGGSLLALRRKGNTTRSLNSASLELIEPEKEQLIFDNQTSASMNKEQRSVGLVGKEVVSSLEGWGDGGFVKPKISGDLPLIWSFDESLEISTPPGTMLKVGNRKAVRSSAIQDYFVSEFISLVETCNVIQGVYEGEIDTKWIRAVHYNEDVVKLFQLNFLIGSSEEEEKNELRVLTAREIVNKIISEKTELIVSDSSLALFTIARIFERALYGRKQISRDEYEDFLRSLSKALVNPKVIICGPKDEKVCSET
ncbi:MAG: hypothetical protein PXY39_15080 [archaeon]|nr:hypothetical protein [archaeon]